jgi:hypothetical protein
MKARTQRHSHAHHVPAAGVLTTWWYGKTAKTPKGAVARFLGFHGELMDEHPLLLGFFGTILGPASSSAVIREENPRAG